MGTFEFADVHEVLFGCEDIDCLNYLLRVVSDLFEIRLGKPVNALEKLGFTAVVVLTIFQAVREAISFSEGNE